MSKIKNGGLDQYGAKPFERQQFGTAGVEGVKRRLAGWGGLASPRPTPVSATVSRVKENPGTVTYVTRTVNLLRRRRWCIKLTEDVTLIARH